VIDSMSLVALGLFSGLCGVFLGLLMTALFYKPGVNRGPTQRLRHLIWSATLLVTECVMVAMALGLYAEQGTPAVEQRSMGAGLSLGAAVGGGWLALRRRCGAQQGKPSTVVHGSSAGARQQSRLRTARRRILRTLDYALGMGLCGIALIGGSIAAQYAGAWLEQRLGPGVMVVVGVHVATFLYGQLVTNRAIAALNTAVRDDWHMRRRSQFLLAAGPFVYAPPLNVSAPGASVSLLVQLVALWLGYRHTDQPPSGAMKVLKQLHSLRLARRAAVVAS
jgi:hypothetical protein